ncbi:MAG: AAA family ATPase [Candidatus Moranbacteria bacterium]|jgi:predicted ATPase|nr:AAA family ATPase [Candidatus Moranbacteria bacterium]
MQYIYSSIKVNGEIFQNYLDKDGSELQSIDNLSRVNIFIGSNNSGKSRFLRELMKIKDYFFNSDLIETKKFLNYVNEISNGIYEIKETYGKNIVSFTIDGYGSFNEGDFVKLDFDYYNFSANFTALKRILSALQGRFYLIRASSYRGSSDTRQLAQKFNAYFDTNEDKINFILSFEIEKIEFNKFYIPILRSLNDFHVAIHGVGKEEERKDFYKQRIENIYNIRNDEKIQIFTGQELYFNVRKMLLGNHGDRKKIADYEKFLSIELFESREVSLIPKVDSDVLHIKIGNDEKAIYDLGDGIQNLIILTFNLFMIDNGLFFIEEPEINLHPGMQRKFIETILNKNGQLSKRNHQYFITTHSNHFLDLTLDYGDISIYKFSSDISSGNKLLKIVEQVSSGDERVLKELGVKNSSVFLTNATIWIEGITDRLYLKKFLELYQNHFENKQKIFEDIDYSFVEYGGNNITHWSFLESVQSTICVDRLCGKSILITDKDDRNKIARQKELKDKLGKRYIRLACREIENILSLDTIEKIIRKYPADKDFVMPKFKEKYPHKDKKIGTFIKGKLKPNNNYESRSGSLASDKKLDFCNKAIGDMKYEDMTITARNLAKKTYDFAISQKK